MKRFMSFVLCSILVFFVLGAVAETLDDPANDNNMTTETPNIYLTIVSKEYKLPEGWTDHIVLVPTQNSLGEEFLVEEVTLAHFNALRNELLDEGIQIELDSTYRSVEEQQAIWDEWSNDPELGPEYCERYLAVPGFSEHHTGLAIDVFIIKPDGYHERENEEMIADRETFTIIHEKLAKYGFILRYPEGKESTTGYNYEPWHFRFVGEDAATEIFEQKITFEEYVAQH